MMAQTGRRAEGAGAERPAPGRGSRSRCEDAPDPPGRHTARNGGSTDHDARPSRVGSVPSPATPCGDGVTGTDTPLRDEPPRFRLLIAEDDDLIAELLGEALKRHFEVRCVPTGAGARSVLLSGGADALLLDERLSDGPAAPVLREADRLGVPALVMTGDPSIPGGAEHRDRSSLAKPFGTTELLLALERVLRTSGCFGRSGQAWYPSPFRSGPRFVVGREDHGGYAL